ncbi:hypothetical protein IV203_025388 [Nitzschia inconspicua]|uniref:Uncharacterized protein n=1 Tax=Nitzschia inconspicua TaxID=303405 RepID=A0A9K3PZ56_9STRA|nr:hypothetical protein IV203_024806 [Nitzschia inconspicua]KAG7362504.1 hypothetical protein IV203_025388 [Nitzschia inconspicua]
MKVTSIALLFLVSGTSGISANSLSRIRVRRGASTATTDKRAIPHAELEIPSDIMWRALKRKLEEEQEAAAAAAAEKSVHKKAVVVTAAEIPGVASMSMTVGPDGATGREAPDEDVVMKYITLESPQNRGVFQEDTEVEHEDVLSLSMSMSIPITETPQDRVVFEEDTEIEDNDVFSLSMSMSMPITETPQDRVEIDEDTEIEDDDVFSLSMSMSMPITETPQDRGEIDEDTEIEDDDVFSLSMSMSMPITETTEDEDTVEETPIVDVVDVSTPEIEETPVVDLVEVPPAETESPQGRVDFDEDPVVQPTVSTVLHTIRERIQAAKKGRSSTRRLRHNRVRHFM